MSAWALLFEQLLDASRTFRFMLLCECIRAHTWNASAGQGKQWKVKSESSKRSLIKERCRSSLHAQFSHLRSVIRSNFDLLFGFCSDNSRVQFSKSKREKVSAFSSKTICCWKDGSVPRTSTGMNNSSTGIFNFFNRLLFLLRETKGDARWQTARFS